MSKYLKTKKLSISEALDNNSLNLGATYQHINCGGKPEKTTIQGLTWTAQCNKCNKEFFLPLIGSLGALDKWDEVFYIELQEIIDLGKLETPCRILWRGDGVSWLVSMSEKEKLKYYGLEGAAKIEI